MTQRQAQTDLPRESFGELLSALASTSAALIRDQIELAKEEMRENLARVRSGFVALAFSAVIGVLALATLCAAAVIGLGILSASVCRLLLSDLDWLPSGGSSPPWASAVSSELD